MLFDIFTLGQSIASFLKPPEQRIGAAAGGEASPIPGLRPSEQQLIISRAAQIPRIGPSNPERRRKSVVDSIRALTDADDGVTLMVRRDGYALRPVVSTAILRTVPDNRNMEGATFLTAMRKEMTVGKDELGLLSNTGVNELQYVAPNGSILSLRKTRPLTVGERRKLGKTVARVAQENNAGDPSRKLRAVAEDSNGAIEYAESFPNVKNPNDLVEVSINGTRRQVRQWVYDTFYKNRKTRRPVSTDPQESPIRTDAPEIHSKITSLAKAVRHLEAGGDPEDVLPTLLPQALQRTKGYVSRRRGRFAKIHTRPGKHVLTEYVPEYDFEHLSARVSSDVQKLVGIDAENVIIAGSGRRAPYLTVDKLTPGETVRPAENLDDLPPSQVLALAVADYVLDNRDRTPNTTQIVRVGDRTYIRSANNKLTLLAGLSSSQASARQRLGVDEAINRERAAYYAAAFRKLSEQQRKATIRELDLLLARLKRFSWEEYLSRLRIDGRLSQAETTHLKIVRSIVESRVDRLQSSRKQFLNILSI